MKFPSALGQMETGNQHVNQLLMTVQPIMFVFFFFRSRFDNQTDTSDSFSSRWGDGGDGGGWMKESRKPEPDFYLSSAISSQDDR